MKRLHQSVIVGATASLVLLGLAGTRARADNVFPIKPHHQTAAQAKARAEFNDILKKVQQREQSDGGCGGASS